jgi:hypothetical protein
MGILIFIETSVVMRRIHGASNYRIEIEDAVFTWTWLCAISVFKCFLVVSIFGDKCIRFFDGIKRWWIREIFVSANIQHAILCLCRIKRGCGSVTSFLRLWLRHRQINLQLCDTDISSLCCSAVAQHGAELMWQHLQIISGTFGECTHIAGSCARSPTSSTSLL